MYTALEKVRKRNLETYGINGPVAPELITNIRKRQEGDTGETKFTGLSTLEERAIHCIRERCEELRFSAKYEACDDREGTSLKKGQIPYNMEKDLDRLCLETAVHRFLESGVAEDAFDIYYIYLELFIGEYNHTKKLIERLSEFESNASSLLMSHRDHYSHSVYVFLIGLAIYDSNASYREKYNAFYGLEGNAAANHFLKYWGLSSLFHDIGYAFELPFEEVVSYFGKNPQNVPYVCYRDMDKYIRIDEADAAKAAKLTDGPQPENSMEILTHRIAQCLEAHYGSRPRMDHESLALDGSESYEAYLTRVFEWKSKDTAVFGNPGRHLGYMDHAYFSAALLMKNLMEILTEEDLNMAFTDAFVAIVLHNSIFKHVIQNQKSADKSFDYKQHAMHAEWHPLTYLLMFCDELQCWDRTSYGQDSRTEVHAMACDFSFGENSITACYKFDRNMEEKANRRKSNGELAVGGTYKKMIATAKDGVIKFRRDIEEIVALNTEGEMDFDVTYEFTDDIKYRKTYLSKSNFMHLYDFAVILSGRRKYDIREADRDEELRAAMEAEFAGKSLEYKMIDIQRVKKFAKYLDAIGCFYTDRPVAYPMVTKITEKEMDIIGPLEHERWLWVHHIMGWKYGTEYEKLGADPEERSRIRELTRTHKLMLEDEQYTAERAREHYRELPESEQDKDTEPMNKLLQLLPMLDGVRFYRVISDED